MSSHRPADGNPKGARKAPVAEASDKAAPRETAPAPPPIYALIATPSHDGKLFENFALSLINFVAEAPSMGLRLQIYILSGESLITRARNNIVAMFLDNPEFTHLFFMDSDIGFTPQAAARLLTAGHDISAGVYPLKHESWPDEGLPQGLTQAQYETLYTRYTVNTGRRGDGDTLELEIGSDGFIELDEAPTGFMCISRHVLERLVEAYPDYRYTPDHLGAVDVGHHYRLFDCAVDPVSKRYLSEDYAFCRLWSAIGGKVHVDARSDLSHRGHKTFRGPFASSLTHALSHAVGAPAGMKMKLSGVEFLQPETLTDG